MDQDYKVVAISPNPPREWDGPNGKVYYISVKLEGHEKPVSIGKKAPDALKVGDTVFGHIVVEQSFPEDKFKAGKKPFPAAGGGFGGGASKPAYQPKDEHAIAKAVALKAAVDWTHSQTNDHSSEKAAGVLSIADQFLAWLEAGKGSSESTDPKAQANPTTSQSNNGAPKAPTTTTANPARLKQGGPTWPSEHSDAEAASLYQSVAQSDFGGEDVPLDSIPF